MQVNDISEKETLSLILSLGLPSDKTLILSNMLYKRFSSLYGISNASIEELAAIKGIGRKRAMVLKAIPSLLEYYLKSRITAEKRVFSMKEIRNYFSLTLRHLKFEMFSFASIDIKKRVISIENMFRGSIQSATVYPRDIMQKILNLGASYIVFAHNHPSGDRTPSKDDIELTKALFLLCESINVKMLDHIIIAGNQKYSFRKEGLINTLKNNNTSNKIGGEYA